MICLNCEKALAADHRYCPACGQKNEGPGLTMAQISHQTMHSLTHADSSIFSLIVQMVYKPGIIAREYVGGKRKKYFSPFSFAVIIIGIATILSTTFNLIPVYTPQGVKADPISLFIAKHPNFVMLASVPLIAYFTTLTFGKKRINFSASMVLSSYTAGERSFFFNLVVAPVILLFREQHYLIIFLYIFFFGLYYGFAATQYFNERTAGTFFRGFFAVVLTQIATILIMFLLITVYYYFK